MVSAYFTSHPTFLTLLLINTNTDQQQGLTVENCLSHQVWEDGVKVFLLVLLDCLTGSCRSVSSFLPHLADGLIDDKIHSFTCKEYIRPKVTQR